LTEVTLEVLEVLSTKEDSRAFVAKEHSKIFSWYHQQENLSLHDQRQFLQIMDNLCDNAEFASSFISYLNELESIVTSLNTIAIDSSLSCLFPLLEILAKVSCSDSNCQSIIHRASLLSSLFLWSSSVDIRICRLSLSVLRNLCIPIENKRILLRKDILPLIISQLKQKKDGKIDLPTQYLCVGVLRALTTIDEAIHCFMQNEALEALISVARGDMLSEEEAYYEKEDDSQVNEKVSKPRNRDRRVEYEAARLLARIADFPTYREELVRKGGIMPLVELLKTRFDVLHEEAFRAILHLIESGFRNQLCQQIPIEFLEFEYQPLKDNVPLRKQQAKLVLDLLKSSD